MNRMEPPTYADILAAAPTVRRFVKPTPLYEWPALSRLLGCRYYLKHVPNGAGNDWKKDLSKYR